MTEEISPRTYFWPYDIFGYLLPGGATLLAIAISNDWGHQQIAGLWQAGRFADLALVAGIAYVVGHVVAGVSSLILEKWIVSSVLRWPTAHMFQEHEEGSLARWLLPSYRRPYSRQFQDAFGVRFKSTLGIDGSDEHDRFWLAWCYVSLHHPTAHRRATHFLELYGFSRNMSMASVLIALCAALPGWTAPLPRFLWVIGALVGGILLFFNYTKLLRRLNDEVYRAFYSTTEVARM